MLTILATIVVLGVLIFVHELGHFMTAKAVDIEVPRFSIGFGPRVIGFKRGETEYVISLLPLGGYVKMAGMEEMEAIEGGPVNTGENAAEAVERVEGQPRTPRPRDFDSKSLPARALVISAGVIMNLLFAFVVFAVLAAVWGVPADPGTRIADIREEYLPAEAQGLLAIQPGARVTEVNGRAVTTQDELHYELLRARAGSTTLTFDNAPPLTFDLPSRDEDRGAVIASLDPSSDMRAILGQINPGPGREAGLQTGDTIVQINGQPVTGWHDFVSRIERSAGVPLPFLVGRDGGRVTLTVTPEERAFDSGLRAGRIGVSPLESSRVPRDRVGVVEAIGVGAADTWRFTSATVDLLAGMVTGRQSARNIGGPIMIGQMSGQFARAGLQYYLEFMAMLSISLAILNLLPIPVLDGGHLVFLAAEGIRGRPLSYQSRMRLTQVGFVFIILLMLWAVSNDVLRLLGI
jgi:regulator of sigma E protease